MSKEEKELLLVDLCARLPYNIIMNGKLTNNIGRDNIDFVLEPALLAAAIACGCKPYLRPMSSMTEEEIMEFTKLFDKWHDDELFDYIEEGAEFSIWKHKGISAVVFDWLNRKMFDYRGLIPMGLALEPLKDMYAVKN